MKGDSVPDAHHVVRYVRGGLIDSGQIDGGAFVRRHGEAALSVNWLEAFAEASTEGRIAKVREHVQLKLGATAVFTRLNVGRTRSTLADLADVTIGFVHDPLGPSIPDFRVDDPSHALMTGLPEADQSGAAEAIGDMIRDTIIDTFPARAT